ncbi:uncharacterized protein OCT59_005050 [Rhizophagus irregularis]|nr:hypothetical protein OCT59_005050 [Rhizophagus irregularis]GBC21434.1 hypothetical protein GLOIN_2v1885764 [Rhizophagus irregularis DAOM 181602=DAOM 197198]
MFNLKVLITFICLISVVSSQNILSRDILSQNGSLHDISPQDISFIYEEPIDGLKFVTLLPTYNHLMIWMAFEDEDPECMLPYFHLRIINKITGQTNYIDLNYTLPAEAVCPINNIDFLPVADNYILLYYAKTTNGIKGKHGMIINYSGEVMSEIYLGNADGYVALSNEGFINIEKPDEKGISAWHWYSSPNIETGEVVEHSSGEFHAPNLPSYTLVDSLNFDLVDGGFGFLYILKYDETKGSSVIKDPNVQYWRIYVSFLKVKTDLPTKPSLLYETTQKLNNITLRLCTLTYNAEGYICVMTLNNTITNNNKSWTEINYYQLGFLSTGALVRLEIIPTPTNITDIDLRALYYGGFIVIYQNASAIDFYLLDDNGNYMQSQGSFGPEFFFYNTYRTISTIFGVKEQAKNKLEFLFKPLPKLKKGSEFSPVIESAKPSINEVIDPLIKEITIKYTIPVKLSTGNVSIFQLNDDKYKPGLLRQTFSGDSKLCTIGSDNHTVHIPIFESTFSQQNSTYYVLVGNNFVISQERDEPLIGIRKNIWTLSTKPLKMAQHSDSVTGLLRLNEEGSSKFLQMNHSIFFKNMIQEFAKVIPVTEQRLSTSGKWQYDPTSPRKVLLSFNIIEAKDNTIESNSQIIFNDISTLINKKRFTALSFNEYTSLIDESAPFTMIRDYINEFYPLIIIFVVGLAVIIVLYVLARRKNPNARNSVIIETFFIMQDIAVDLAFILLKVKNTPHLFIPTIIFFILPIVINFLLAINIFVSEMAMNPSFNKWVKESPTLSSMGTLFSAIDIQILNTLSSDLFGLRIFSAPLTQRSKKIMLWGVIINIFVEDIPQIIIQGLYYNSVITYDLIPSLVLASGGLVIANKLILRSYHALLRWNHQRDKIREYNRNRRLSAASIRSIRSN